MEYKYCSECSERNLKNAIRCDKCQLAFEGEETINNNFSDVENDPPELPQQAWYYTYKGERTGPVSEDEIIRLCKSNELDFNNLVWTKGMSNWLPIIEVSQFSKYFSSPPPVIGNAVSNTIVWWLAFIPIIGLVIENFFSGIFNIDIGNLWYVTLVLNVILCALDQKRLEKLGHKTSSLGWALLVPIYLFIRARKLKQKYIYPIVWGVCFIIATSFPSYVLGYVPSSNQQLVSVVKNGHFDSYPNKTIGSAFDSYLGTPRWEGVKGTDGNNYVNVSGDVTYEQKSAKLIMQFQIDSETGRFSVHSMVIDTVPQNQLVINGFIAKVLQ